MTVIGRTERGGVHAPASAARPGHVLPAPPRDDEKYQYARRRAWILVVFSVASTPLLLFSQARLMAQHHWFLVASPFVLLGALFLALPLPPGGQGPPRRRRGRPGDLRHLGQGPVLTGRA
jgi:hypothetical protein